MDSLQLIVAVRNSYLKIVRNLLNWVLICIISLLNPLLGNRTPTSWLQVDLTSKHWYLKTLSPRNRRSKNLFGKHQSSLGHPPQRKQSYRRIWASSGYVSLKSSFSATILKLATLITHPHTIILTNIEINADFKSIHFSCKYPPKGETCPFYITLNMIWNLTFASKNLPNHQKTTANGTSMTKDPVVRRSGNAVDESSFSVTPLGWVLNTRRAS